MSKRAAKSERRDATRSGGDVERINGIVIGELVGFWDEGAIVRFGGATAEAFRARCAAAIGMEALGREVALAFEGGDPRKPIVLGVLQRPAALPASEDDAVPEQAEIREVDIDGDRITLLAHTELVLRCGKASITLTRAGKILLRGAYLSSRSSGVNRIKGGSVQIN